MTTARPIDQLVDALSAEFDEYQTAVFHTSKKEHPKQHKRLTREMDKVGAWLMLAIAVQKGTTPDVPTARRGMFIVPEDHE